MNFDDYQLHASTTTGPADDAVYNLAVKPFLDLATTQEEAQALAIVHVLLRLNYAITGIANEAGEVGGKMKKLIRDGRGIIDDEFKMMLEAEMGDVLWYMADICSVLELRLDDVAEGNLQKLRHRAKAGTLQGDGDTR
tara:strand:- start:9373 stop:9786 length:414 start_codon:yes stop_codon:yes gene_type:complete